MRDSDVAIFKSEFQRAVGLIGLNFLVVAELMVVLELRRLSISEYVRSRDPVSGIVYLLMLGVFAFMPWLLSRRRRASMGRRS